MPYSFLHVAALRNDVVKAQQLIDGEAKDDVHVWRNMPLEMRDKNFDPIFVDERDASGWTPLMIAALGAHRGVVRQLVMHRRPPTFNYDAITKPIAGVSEYALEFRASGRWRSAPTLTPAGGSAVAGRTSPTRSPRSPF